METIFSNIGLHIDGIIHLSPNEAFNVLKNNAILLDVRENYETIGKTFGVENVIYLPKSEFLERFNELPKDKPLVIADSVGLRSKKIYIFLASNGFSNLANLNGGIVDWEKDGLPMNIDKGEMLTGSCLCQLRPKKRFSNTK
ncbi:MAG: rhodanese-like domain-containing protein [Bacteroidetes bacterium]|nr:rhodanese-like domain-containing protein [Bacteroidota bacterium]